MFAVIFFLKLVSRSIQCINIKIWILETRSHIPKWKTNHQWDNGDCSQITITFKLDQLTEGHGNCFPISIIQQCKRPEIYSQLRTIPKRLVKDKTGYSTLRHHVRQFISKSKHPNVQGDPEWILQFFLLYLLYFDLLNNISWK